MEIMKDMPSASFDLILTDPPYSLPNNQFRPEARMLQRTFGEFSPYLTFFRSFVAEAKRLLTPNGDLIVFCDETFYPVIYPALYQNFYATKMVIWDKERIGMGGIWRRQFEVITHSYLSPKKEKSGQGDIIKFSPVRGDAKVHTSQKPVDLVKFLIQKTGTKNVLDPFMGSGTTLVAAKELGIEATGIEISPEHCEIARKRLL